MGGFICEGRQGKGRQGNGQSGDRQLQSGESGEEGSQGTLGSACGGRHLCGTAEVITKSRSIKGGRGGSRKSRGDKGVLGFGSALQNLSSAPASSPAGLQSPPASPDEGGEVPRSPICAAMPS